MTNEIQVNLNTPIKIGDQEIKTLKITKPNAGSLRGVKMLDVLQMDVDAHAKILPRICNEITSEQFVMDMDCADLAFVMGKVVSFFNRGAAQ